MPDNEARPLKQGSRVPWNNGKLIGPKPHCDQSMSGRLETARAFVD